MVVFTKEPQFGSSGGKTDGTHFKQDPACSGLSPVSYPERNVAVSGTECWVSEHVEFYSFHTSSCCEAQSSTI